MSRRKLSQHPDAIRERKRVRLLKKELENLLGKKACRDCGVTYALTVHHQQGKDWSARKTRSRIRLKKYIEEAKAGLLCWLCADCNRITGTVDEDKYF